MHNLYEVLMLCESVYKNNLLLPNWKSIDKQVGNKDLTTGEVGYFGEAFMHNEHPLIVVVHRGTKLYKLSEKYQPNAHQDKKNVAISVGNLINDAMIALKHMPPEIQPALGFAVRIIEEYPVHQIVQVGHSLGGLHANIAGYFCKQDVVAIDPVGCKEILLKLLAEMNLKLDLEQCEKHLNLLAQDNIINSVNEHIGKVYQRKINNNNINNNEDANITSRAKTTFATHSVKNFLEVITVDRMNLGLQVPDVFVLIKNSQELIEPVNNQLPIPAAAQSNSLPLQISDSEALQIEIRNSINATHILRQDNAVVSLLRNKGRDHVYIILEWLDENKKRVILRAELGYKIIENTNPPKVDETKGQIFVKNVTYQWLTEKSKARAFYFQTFELDLDEKQKLLDKINSDTNKTFDYVEFGNLNTLFGGGVGDSLEVVGLFKAKNASIEANHKYLGDSQNPSSGIAHASIDAILHRGYSCVAWATLTVHSIKKDYNPSILGYLFVQIPQWEVGYEGEEQHNTGRNNCRII